MKRSWLISLRNLQRNIKRNLATGSAIAFGFAGILILGGYANRVSKYLEAYTVYVIHTGHIAIYADGGFANYDYKPKNHSLGPDDQKSIETVLGEEPEVEFFERQLWGSGLLGNGCLSLPFRARGVEPEIDRKVQGHPMVRKWMPHFRPFLEGQGLWNYSADLAPVALSRKLARGLGKMKVHDELPSGQIVLVDCTAEDASLKFKEDANVQFLSGTWSGSLAAVDGEVVAHFTTGMDESDNSAVMAPVGLLQQLFDTDRLARYSVWLKDPSKTKDMIQKLRARLGDSGKKYEFFAWNNHDLSPYYSGTIQFLFSMVGFIAIVMAMVIGFSVLNSTTMTVLERSQEIGTYRALGFRRSHVKRLFVLESVWLALISLIIGTILGLAAIYFINAAEIIYYPPGVSEGLRLLLVLDPLFAVLAGVVILMLTVLATLLSATGQLRHESAELLGGTVR